MQLIKEQIQQFEAFVSKLPISKVRSDIERLWDAVKNDGYIIRYEQLDKLKDYSIHIEDSSMQTFIQSFEHWVKNEDGSESPKEAPKEEIPKANLGEGVAHSIKKTKVVDKDTSDNSVSQFDDKNNDAALKLSKEKIEKNKELEKEAKAGDLHRPISGMKDKKVEPKPEAKKVVVIKKSSHKNKKK